MKKYQKIIITALLWSLITIIFSTGIVLAQGNENISYKMQVGLPGLENTITMDKGNTYYIALFVQALYKYGISIVAILAAVMIMAGGVIWLTSAGSQESVSKAKDMIIGSLTGLILLFGSWVILNTINPALVNFEQNNITMVPKIEKFCHLFEGIVMKESSATRKCDWKTEGCIGSFETSSMGDGYDYVETTTFVYRCRTAPTGCCITRFRWPRGEGCTDGITEYFCESDEHNPRGREKTWKADTVCHIIEAGPTTRPACLPPN